MPWATAHTAGAGTSQQVADAHDAFDALGLPPAPLAVRSLRAAELLQAAPPEEPEEESALEAIHGDYWNSIMLALTYQAKGDPLPDDLQESAMEAAIVLAAAALVRGGADIDDVERQFVDRDYTVKLVYDGATDEIGVDILWEDGTLAASARDAAPA